MNVSIIIEKWQFEINIFWIAKESKKGKFVFWVFKIIILIIYYIWKKEMIISIFRIWIIIFSNKLDSIKNFKLLKYITKKKRKINSRYNLF